MAVIQIVAERVYDAMCRVGWGLVVGAVAVLFFGCWAGLAYFEPADSELVRPSVYWWYFIVTCTTVGYGDYSAVTVGGRIMSAIIMVGGIGIFAGIVGEVANTFIALSQRRQQGMTSLSVQNHVVIFGYRPGETEDLVREMRGDHTRDGVAIVLCSSTTEKNPLPDEIEFVRGELTSEDVMDRACVPYARKVLIHGHSDDQTLAIGIAVNNVVSAHAHIVAYFTGTANARLLKQVNDEIECVTSLSVPLLVQAIQDPGSSGVIGALTSNQQLGTQYRLNIPRDVGERRFGDLLGWFKETYDATVIAVGESHAHNAPMKLNPSVNERVRGGMSLVYIAAARLPEIQWEAQDPIPAS